MKVLPLYLPQRGCRHQCVYCNQPLTTGVTEDRPDWRARIAEQLARRPDEEWEIAFYAGTFGALAREEMDACFETAAAALPGNRAPAHRVSTRPDAADAAVLGYWRERGVRTVELGVESLDDAVLRKSGRGHTAQTARGACRRVLDAGFQLGVHLMCGLPGQDLESWRSTVAGTIGLGPHFVRIAPTLVLKNTPLETLYRRGRYAPLPLEDAIGQCALALREFSRAGIAVARVGLALSDGNGDGSDKVVAGPWHPSLRHETESRLAGETIGRSLERDAGPAVCIHPKDLSIVAGPGGRNRRAWRERTGAEAGLVRDPSTLRHRFHRGDGVHRPLFYEP